MRKGDFAGTKEVFLFTLRQYLKSKSTIAAMAVMLAVSIASLFIAAVSMSKGVVERTAVERIVVVDETGSGVEADAVRAAQPLFADADVLFGEDADATGAHTAVVRAAYDASGAWSAAAANGPEGELEQYDLSLAAEAVRAAVQEARLDGLALSEEELGRISSGRPIVQRAGDYLAEKNSPEEMEEAGPDSDASYFVTYIYSILVMVLVNFSASYIVRSVVEEKASKLVEFLMVSVKPMALIAGKLLASMCLVLIELAVLIGGVVASWYLAVHVFGMAALTDLVSALGVSEALVNMGAGLAAAVVVSILLAYVVYSLIGALSGVCCSTMEDVQSANGTVVMTVMVGYIVSIATSFVTGRTASVVLSLLPVVSAFTAPARYAMGQIGLGVLALSWLVQLLVIALLAMLCKRVYAALLMHRGSRVKFGQLLRVFRETKGGAQA